MRDELKKLQEAIDILEQHGYTIVEDFGIGVGAPVGLDQGIPHGGDCKGVAPVILPLFSRRASTNNPNKELTFAHKPGYWLSQIKKRRRKKKNRHR